jgi:hypothetical protein
MNRSTWTALRASLFAMTVVFSGCAEMEEAQVPPHLTDAVRVSREEPGSNCRPLGAIESLSNNDSGTYESAYDTLRQGAAVRGGNYVVIDLVSAPSLNAGSDLPVIIRGRIYACTLGMPQVQTAARPTPPAPAPAAAARAPAPAAAAPIAVVPPSPLFTPAPATLTLSQSVASPVPASPPVVMASAQAPAAAPMVQCEPSCSPGYLCIRGSCVSACNPPCSSDQHCGEDRTCH